MGVTPWGPRPVSLLLRKPGSWSHAAATPVRLPGRPSGGVVVPRGEAEPGIRAPASPSAPDSLCSRGP